MIPGTARPSTNIYFLFLKYMELRLAISQYGNCSMRKVMAHFQILLISVAIIAVHNINCDLDGHGDLPVLSRRLRYVVFPEGTVMGLVLAANIAIDVKGDLSESWFLQADYHVPEDAQDFIYPFDLEGRNRTSRELDRTGAYRLLEDTFNRFGFDGMECILRTICEAAQTPLYKNEYNGLLGELLHILFVPSSSLDENLPPSFNIAERRGEDGKNCRVAYSKCSFGLIDSITTSLEE
ncbi:uncharacterized protein [Periplaneta americana]|uniref:uncharacterized protein isoform X1 n=1 Tax=Periplaneta americana TaxID=6978 RepID=UPI0037E8510A